MPASGQTLKNLSYLPDDESYTLDLHLPETEGPHPVCVWIPCSGFVSSIKPDEPLPFLLKQGYAIATMNVHTTGESGRRWEAFPQNLLDCKFALNFLARHAEEYNLDTTSFFVLGQSAGAVLACLTAWHTDDTLFEIPKPQPTIKGVVSICGAADRDYDPPDRCPPTQEIADQASPKKWITGKSTPVLICHGSEDQVVPLNQAHRLKNACEAHRLEYEFIIFDRQDHSLSPDLWGDHAVAFINRFKRKTL